MIAIHDKTRGLVGAVGINDAAHLNTFLLGADLQSLIRDNADGMSPEPRVDSHNCLAVVCFVFIDRVCIDNRREQIARLVLFLAVETNELVKRVGIFRRLRHFVIDLCGLCRFCLGQERDERTEPIQTRCVVLFVKIDRAAYFRVHLRAAELFCIDNLADGRFNERWTGEVQTASFCH